MVSDGFGVAGLNLCCAKTNDGSNVPSPFGFHGTPVNDLSKSLLHFSEGTTHLIVLDFTKQREVTTRCSLLSEARPSHVPFVNDESAFFAASCFPGAL